jgi:gluconolactonase
MAALVAAALLAPPATLAAPRPFSITRNDPAFDAIIAPSAQLELLGDRFGITEGPAWIPDGRDGFLVVSDLTANVIYNWKAGSLSEAN